jgi:HSP20 family protein
MASQSEHGKGTKKQDDDAKSAKAGGSVPVPYQRGTPSSSWGLEPAYRLREEFNRLFDQLWPGRLSLTEGMGRGGQWGLDVQEDDGNVVVRAEAPGFEPADFDLQVRGDQLVLQASHKAEAEEKERGYHEWSRQDLYRVVSLPPGIEAGKVEANYRNGVLTVRLPKSEESKGRRITVQG